MRTIGHGVFDSGVVDIATSAGMIAVGTYTDKVYLLDYASGDVIRSFGEKGIAEGKLNGNNGLRFTPDGGHILIAENRSKRLSLFTLAGEFVRCIGVGSLNRPDDVDFATNGDIVVADYGKHCICVFSPDGSTLLRSFGSQGSEAPGRFNNPTALAVLGNQLYVLDRESARVQVFN